MLCSLFLLPLPLFRRLSYEAFLRLHQALTVVCAYTTWRHLEPEAVFTRLVISVMAITFASMFLVQSAHLVYHNEAVGAGLSRAQIVRSGGTVRIRRHCQDAAAPFAPHQSRGTPVHRAVDLGNRLLTLAAEPSLYCDHLV